MTDIYGGNTDSTFPNGLSTNSIDDLELSNDNVKIDLSVIDSINIIAPTVLVNGVPISGGGGGVVTNPLSANLSIGIRDIIGLPSGKTLKGITNSVVLLDDKTVNIVSASFPTTTTMTGILRIPTIATDQISDTLETSYIDMTVGGINLTSGALNFNSNTVLSATGTGTQYFMGDGSLLQYSANSGNSNFYLYKSHTNTPAPPPDDGFVYYNNANQSLVTLIYISHLTDDVIDIEVFYSNISSLNEVYLQDKSLSDNYIRYNITATPTIVVGSHIAIPVSVMSSGGTGSTSFGVNRPILLSFFTNSIEVDTRLSTLETKTQYQTGLTGTGITGFTGDLLVSGETNSGTFRKTGGTVNQFLKANGTVDSNTYAIGVSTQIVSSVPYINALGQVSSNISNLFVQQGNNTIASAVLAVQTGVGYSIQLSASGFTETLTLGKQNYILAGTDSPLFAPTTEIIGNTLIGSNSALSTRIKIKDIKFSGNLEFISSAFNGLRTYISNCEIVGTLIFPAVSGDGTTWIYFFDCSIGGAITIPNQATYGIVFTRCNFTAQTITNSLLVGNTANLVYRECSGLLNLTLDNCIQYGMNTTYLGVSKSSAGSFVKDLGTSSMFLKADGTVDSIAYSYRKFSKIGVYAVVPLNTGNTNLIPSVNGLVTFLADEAKAGDVYTLTIRGTYTTTAGAQVIRITVSGFNNQFGIGGTLPFPSNLVGSFYFTMTVNYTFLTSTSATQIVELLAGGTGNSTSTVVNSGYAANGNSSCNITTSSTFTVTAASSVASGNSIGIYCAVLSRT